MSPAGPSAGVPTALTIPAIGLDTSVVPLGRNADGTAQVPDGFNFAGWYDLGPRPGEIGPAIILGHVDSIRGPAVFFNLSTLLPGDAITVHEGAASAVIFTVRRVATYAKGSFPTHQVFGPTPDPELRLITCGGPFDYAIGHYEDNIVVYAQETKDVILTGT
jgi:sortase (surface protein transpeptidase)